MNDMTPAAGHNNPPSPIDDATAPFADYIEMAEGWLDGKPVTTETQMQEVDDILANIRKASTAVENARKADTAPFHKAWQDRNATWKPTVDDLERIKKGLAKTVDSFKRKLAAEKRAAEQAAWEAANKARREAEAKAAAADAANIDQQREAEAAKQAAMDAEKAAQAARRETKDVKGLRTVTRYEIEDHSKLLHWIARNDREYLTAAIEEWARKNHKTHRNAEGLRVWDGKEAY